MSFDKGFFHRSTTLLVLSLLVDGDKYGYQLVQELESRSDQSFYKKEGDLYPILYRLERDKVVLSYEKESGKGRRRYYRLTRKGLLLFHEQATGWKLSAQKVNAMVGEKKDAVTRRCK